MIIASLANAAWFAANFPAFSAYQLALDDPIEAQRQLLMQYVRTNRNTAFGISHGFSEIRSPESFASRVPLSDYEDLEPWIDRIKNGEPNILTADPVIRLVPTSGSTRARKLILYTAGLQREFNNAIGPWIFDLFRANPSLMLGRAYWSITPAFRVAEDNNSKVPIGFDEDSAYLCGIRKRLVDSVMAVPGWVAQIESIDAFRYVTLLLLLRCRDLRLISVWHPSFLSQLLATLPGHWESLLHDIATGQCDAGGAAPRSMPALPLRAAELERLDPNEPASLWPSLGLISCWGDAHAAAASRELAMKFPGIPLQPKGLLATEGVVTIPFAGQQPLAIRSHFYEFIDSAGRCRLAGDLRTGESYSVVITNAGGLWRYRLHDRVQVVGYHRKTPCLRFFGKEAHISDRFGEKLSDIFVGRAMEEIFLSCRVSPSFAMLAPDVDTAGCRYTLYVEPPMPVDAEAMLDEQLQTNPHYAYCRQLGQLLPARIYMLQGKGFDAYSTRLLERGMRLGDVKPVFLSVIDGWSEHFPGTYLADPS